MSGRRADAVVALLVGVVLLVALLPSWQRPESTFDEGFALAYGVRVLDGDVPHRDFVSFYGPGNPWLTAGSFAIGGTDQATERALGLLYRLLIVLGLAGVAAAGGRVAALAAGLLAVPLLLRMGVPAYASLGALGFALSALALLTHGRDSPSRLVAAGFASGLCALIRPEFGAALAVAAVPLLLALDRRRLVALGAAPPLLALIVHLAIVGPDRVGRVLDDLAASGSGRRLPFDAFGAMPDWEEASRLLVLILLVAIGVGAAAAVRRRAGGALALALLGLALVPHALSRLDYTHVVIPLIPAVGAVPAAVGGRWRAAGAAAALLATLLVAAPTMVEGYVRSHANQLLGRVPGPQTREVVADGRSFRMDPIGAAQLQPIIDAALRERRARTLFVGPGDLRRSNINDAFIYYLLRDLEPASYYVEMNPWTANRPGSGLVEDLRRADLLILNHAWDAWDEPNASDRLGPSEPNEVVAREFCRVLRSGPFELLRRCPDNAPSGIGPGGR